MLVSKGRPTGLIENRTSAHKQMNMIRHNYVTADGDVEVTVGTLGISDKRHVDFLARQIRLPQVSAKGDKIERARVKETIETWRAASEIMLHEETSNHAPVYRPIRTSNSKLSLTGHRPVATTFVALEPFNKHGSQQSLTLWKFMNIQPVKNPRTSVALILAAVLIGIGPSLASAANISGATPTPTPTPFSHPLLFPPVATEANVSIGIDEGCVQILDGPCTNMWTYGDTYPGTTIRRPTGQTTNVTFNNNLDPAAGELTVHNHGNHSSAVNDGQPENFLIETGGSRTYIYDGLEAGGNARGATHFYHDHRMDVTGRNVWMGLTGMYIVDDPADPATLPSGAFDLPLTIADRQFDANNQIPYVFDPNGVTGDKILINGVYQPYLEVGDRKYRLRILNASNHRTYFLELSSGDSFTQIGTESGLLPAPVTRTGMRIGPAERLDVVVDFAGKLGQEGYLTDTLTGMQLLQFRVTQHLIDDSSIPPTLRSLPDIGEPTVTRNWSFDRAAGHWTINGLRFDPERVDARPVLGTTEKWVFTNPTGQAHTVHIHDVSQQCISRNGGACYPYETMKETWYLAPGETLEIKLKFTDHLGMYMLHCHMLEHEDDGMMTQFEVVRPAPAPRLRPTPRPRPTPR